MSNESNPPHPISAEERWREAVLQELKTLVDLPREYVHMGPVYEVETRTGMKLTGETYLLDLKECTDAGLAHLVKNAFIGGIRGYLVVKDAAGRVVGTRISSLCRERRVMPGRAGVLVRSRIQIIDKGQGLAWPVEQAFQLFLQDYADFQGLPVVWKVENQNLDALEAYREQPDVDPVQLALLEKEQVRWQTLYGPGGKIGVVDGKKVFEPRKP
jgi:hypothetical protein